MILKISSMEHKTCEAHRVTSVILKTRLQLIIRLSFAVHNCVNTDNI